MAERITYHSRFVEQDIATWLLLLAANVGDVGTVVADAKCAKIVGTVVRLVFNNEVHLTETKHLVNVLLALRRLHRVKHIVILRKQTIQLLVGLERFLASTFRFLGGTHSKGNILTIVDDQGP